MTLSDWREGERERERREGGRVESGRESGRETKHACVGESGRKRETEMDMMPTHLIMEQANE